MAKISAHGDEAIAAYKDESGCRMVLTKKRRLLRNYLKGDKLTVIATNTSDFFVEQYAKRAGFRKL